MKRLPKRIKCSGEACFMEASLLHDDYPYCVSCYLEVAPPWMTNHINKIKRGA